MNKLEQIREYMNRNDIDGVLLISPENVRWLSGFSGDSAQILVTQNHQYFITDCRYIEQAEREMGDTFRYIKAAHAERLRRIDKLLDKHGTKCLGIEKEVVTISLMQKYQESWFMKYAYIDEEIKRLRSIKTPEELARMREGAKITQAAFEHILDYVKEGVSEFDLLAELQYFLNKQGTVPSFPPIIASGENAALPHATVSHRKLQAGDLLTMDFGCIYQGICTDFTRTIGISGVEEELEMIYNIVKSANLAGLEAVRAGIGANEVDQVVRSVIQEAGYGAYFEHGTGHGVGVEIHEAPAITAYSTDVLKENMVITIEPGIYLPGKGGVRIEDMIAVTEEGYENFYTAAKDLIIK